MKAPSPRYTHVERARKKIVFTLLYYTGARVTYNDLMVEKIRFYLMVEKIRFYLMVEKLRFYLMVEKIRFYLMVEKIR